MYKNPFEKGRLIISFNITFPENGQIDPKRLGDLEKLLPPRPRLEVPVDAEEHTLIELDPAEERSKRQESYMDEDGGMPGGAKRVQCANQ